ncbi:hypothetical protein E2C01_012964 [Portunus trituberculatus]|uniref:EGF-like domain-containing protein n=1 Tax=Portunus trituberculatus TaxID=210409 RepID=A0A5B7DFK8_PORTR|nr:hypothetical protein [Portunus trituberculatus]
MVTIYSRQHQHRLTPLVVPSNLTTISQFAPVTNANECEREGSCDQVCTNRDQGFSCSCGLGYDLVGISHCRGKNEGKLAKGKEKKKKLDCQFP